MSLEIPAPADLSVSAHSDLHSEQGAWRGEHPGRAHNPVIKVRDLAWLVFEKPDLDRAEVFARDFGFVVAGRTDDELRLRGSFAGTDAVVIRRGPTSRFVGPVFAADEPADLQRLARHTGARVRPLDAGRAGSIVDLVDPTGIPVGVVHGAEAHPPLPEQVALTLNTGTAWRDGLRRVTVEAGELTPSLKIKRAVVARNFAEVIESIYLRGAGYRSAQWDRRLIRTVGVARHAVVDLRRHDLHACEAGVGAALRVQVRERPVGGHPQERDRDETVNPEGIITSDDHALVGTVARVSDGSVWW